jgi:hypothetical protein
MRSNKEREGQEAADDPELTHRADNWRIYSLAPNRRKGGRATAYGNKVELPGDGASCLVEATGRSVIGN